ncbi:formate transporter 1-related [Anaeramoeba flamelloides]|uniref:Formate transporter 1-related n=1 Tax=Anaeramoeba flamelloides TaxID=1746091 RepID=A0AAV8AJJ8_9EUKA|nr:formate transporter 1-related [Anaeramoeba flamelloides]
MKRMKTGKESLYEIIEIGYEKSKKGFLHLSLSSLVGGIYIGFTCLIFLMTVGGSPTIRESDPGLGKFLGGVVTPVGFIIAFICGSDHFTDGLLYTIPPLFSKRTNILSVFSNWGITFLFNLFGAFLCAWLFSYQSNLLDNDPVNSFAKAYLSCEANSSIWGLFLKGVGGAYLACLGFYLAVAAQDILSKIFGLWFPLMAMGSLGMKHATMSMYYLPLALLINAPNSSFFKYFWHNLLPISIGNIIGGTFFVATIYYYLYYQKDTVDLDSNGSAANQLDQIELSDNDLDEVADPNLTRRYRVRKVDSILRSKSDGSDGDQQIDSESDVSDSD